MSILLNPPARLSSNLQLDVLLHRRLVSLEHATHDLPEDGHSALITTLALGGDNHYTGIHIQLLSNFYKSLQSSSKKMPYRLKEVLRRMQEQPASLIRRVHFDSSCYSTATAVSKVYIQ